MKKTVLKISEIFYSIQGESMDAGRPCIFIRLSGCENACSYCDTPQARSDGTEMPVDEIMKQTVKFPCRFVCVTGGEPLLQQGVFLLIKCLLDNSFDVAVETAGYIDISRTDPRVKIIMDLKCPGSREDSKNRYKNLDYLKPTDEVKFVISTKADYEWAKQTISDKKIQGRCAILFSPAYGVLNPAELARWILSNGLNVRIQVQLHKLIGLR